MAGLIDSQAEEVMAAYVNQFDFHPGESQDEWLRLISDTKR